jgi:hypothetical protein
VRHERDGHDHRDRQRAGLHPGAVCLAIKDARLPAVTPSWPARTRSSNSPPVRIALVVSTSLKNGRCGFTMPTALDGVTIGISPAGCPRSMITEPLRSQPRAARATYHL